MKNLHVLFLAIAVLLAAPASQAFAQQPAAGSVPAVRVAVNNWMGYVPVHIAVAKGFFKGIEVTPWVNEDDAAIHAAYDSGQVDVMLASVDMMPIVLNHDRKGKAFFLTDESSGGDGIIAKRDIHSIAELKGKRIACTFGTYSYWFLVLVLEKAGLSLHDVTLVEVDSATSAANAFLSGSVDAAVTFEPFLSQVVSSSKGVILKTSRDFPDGILDVFIGSEKFLANQAAVDAFVEGWLRGMAYTIDRPQEAEAIAAKAQHVTIKEVQDGIHGLAWGTAAMNQRIFNGSNAVGPKVYEKAAQVYLKEGVIKQKPPPAADVFTDQAGPVFERMQSLFK